MSDTDKWFVLEEEDEMSFSTVHQSDVIYDEKTVKVGDSVTFFYNKKDFLGQVRLISDDHEQCVKEAIRLNKLRKKESQQANDGRCSFHAEPKKVRKAAAKAKSTLTNIKSNQKQILKPSQAEKKARLKKITKDKKRIELKENMEKLVNKRLLEDDDVFGKKTIPIKRANTLSVQPHEESDVDNNKEVEEMDFNSSESRNSYGSSTDNSDDEEIEKEKLIRQLSAKLDITMLRKLANKDATETTSSKASSLLAQLSSSSHDYLDAENSFGNGSHDSSNPSRSNGQEVKSNKPENLGNVNNGPNNLPDPSIVDQQPINAFHEDMSINTCNVNPPINDDNKQNVGNGQIQIYTITNPERGVCISEEDQIYCTKKAYTKAEESNCATKALRAMLEGVFTKDTLMRCSVSGLPPRGKGRQAYTQDPSMVLNALPIEGVDAIINKVLVLQREKRMRPKKVQSELRSTLSTRLCEIRKREQAILQQQNQRQ